MSTEKYLVSVEFRYHDAPDKIGSTYRSKTVTIGVFDDFDDACGHGNGFLEKMEDMFAGGKRHPTERFSRKGGPFGTRMTLVTEMGFLHTPFAFFAEITTLHHLDPIEAANEAAAATRRYWEYKKKDEDE